MDLISREAAIEAVKIPNGEYSNPSERHGIIIARVEARRRIREIPSVPAVPMDKLCEWLQENASLTYGTLISAAGWKHELTRWMEEQNGTDNP